MTLSRHAAHLLWVLVLAVFAGMASAQTAQLADGEQDPWPATAARAQAVIDAGRASNAALDRLRRELVDFRETFLSARDRNKPRIRSLQSQLDALGPKPEAGDEASEIAELRSETTRDLQALTIPNIVADKRYFSANGLIGEIDRLVRDRRWEQLVTRGPTPLNPALWPAAAKDLSRLGTTMTQEVLRNWQSEVVRDQLKKTLPLIGTLVLAGALLLIRGGTWSDRIGNFLRSFGGRGTGVWTFVVSLAKVVLPLIGISLLCRAAALSGLFGLRGTMLLAVLPAWGAIILVFKWLADQVYVERRDETLEPLATARRNEAWYLAILLSVMLVVNQALALFERLEDSSEATRSVLGFLPIVVTALMLVRLQKVGMRYRPIERPGEETDGRHSGMQQFVYVLRRVLVLLGVASVMLAAFGYGSAADAIIYPAVLTLAVVSVVVVLHWFVDDVYGWLSRKGASAGDSLFSVLVGGILTLAALPFLALIWGARVSDLTELWSRFLEGFQIGDTRISPTDFLSFVLIFMIGYGATRLVQSGLRNSLLPKTRIDPGGQNAIVAGVGYVGIFLAALLAVTGAGLDLSSLAIVAGALSVGIGFGLQTIVSNFVSGIILLVERPVSKGDWIDVGGQQGYVRDISVRATRIETFDRTDVIVPNSDLISSQVTNYTHGKTIGRVIVPVGVAYGTDTRKVETILNEIANAHPMVLANPAPNIVFQGFGADALEFEIRAILRDVNWVLSVKSDMNHDIARRFAEEGIEIPFSQRDIWLRNPEVLPGLAQETG